MNKSFLVTFGLNLLCDYKQYNIHPPICMITAVPCLISCFFQNVKIDLAQKNNACKMVFMVWIRTHYTQDVSIILLTIMPYTQFREFPRNSKQSWFVF